ncbi:M20 family metallopeptidase [Kutzneria viridogrisea]|uniref:Glutamate carboxypeptidase n=1 Tax=Kutzneria viridogrisea TaxID=47990 RepID=A0ABR6B902_9PSEU|nr:glutamate carboxypeptidase [Kutzneria viridogrisea]
MTPASSDLLAELTGRTEDMVRDVLALCRIESPSDSLTAQHAVADLAEELGSVLFGRRPERIVEHGRPALLWAPEPGGVLLLGHLDTVWPTGTLARWPVPQRTEHALSAPGVFDMKAGVVQGWYALHAIGAPRGCGMLLNTDEEIGSPDSRALIERAAAGSRALLVLEPSADGALKTGRKGASRYQVAVTGRAAHAGLDPANGINALLELADQVRDIAALSTGEVTVVPTLARAGTTTNTIPAEALVHIDARFPTLRAQRAVDTRIRALIPYRSGASVRVSGGPDCPPMEPSQSAELFRLAQRAARTLGLAELTATTVGGASDGNTTAALGIPTLDGLGAVGACAHAEGEYALIAEMPRRAALVAELVTALLAASDQDP